jgi:hypothetical protein
MPCRNERMANSRSLDVAALLVALSFRPTHGAAGRFLSVRVPPCPPFSPRLDATPQRDGRSCYASKNSERAVLQEG